MSTNTIPHSPSDEPNACSSSEKNGDNKDVDEESPIQKIRRLEKWVEQLQQENVTKDKRITELENKLAHSEELISSLRQTPTKKSKGKASAAAVTPTTIKPRRRRKASSVIKKKKQRSVNDFTNDDAFHLLGSNEDLEQEIEENNDL